MKFKDKFRSITTGSAHLMKSKQVESAGVWSKLAISHIIALVIVVLLALASTGKVPSSAAMATHAEIFVDPWQQALESYWGYQKLERQIGHDQTLKVVELVETSGHPDMIKAIIEVESAWRVKARSRKDARGLMQIRHIAAREVDPYVTNDELYEPVRNVVMGIEIFEKHMEYYMGFDDPEHWALTSYNRGRRGTFALKMDPPSTRYSRKVLELTDRM